MEYTFERKVIEFDTTSDEIMINATEMGKVFGKRPVDFLKQEGTKAFIEELKRAFPAFRSDAGSLLNAGNAALSDENVVRTEQGKSVDGGVTWMHRQLALKFAAWLDPRFEVWIYITIEKILLDHDRVISVILKEKANLANKREALILKLENDKNYIELQKVETEIKKANSKLYKYNNSQLDLFRNT